MRPLSATSTGLQLGKCLPPNAPHDAAPTFVLTTARLTGICDSALGVPSGVYLLLD